VRNLHLEAREAVEKARSSGEQLHPPLRLDELDGISDVTRREQVAVASTSVVSEHDYRAISGLEVPTASCHPSADSYAPPDPMLVEQMVMVSSAASAASGVFPGDGEEEFGVGPVHHAAGRASPRQPYILDASWQDFVAQLGF
jgi:hypothetical protein